jgi:hypothetical protein
VNGVAGTLEGASPVYCPVSPLLSMNRPVVNLATIFYDRDETVFDDLFVLFLLQSRLLALYIQKIQ